MTSEKIFTSICISLLYSLGCSEIDRKTAEPQEPTKRILKRAQQIVRQGQAQWVEHKCISIRHRIHSGLNFTYTYITLCYLIVIKTAQYVLDFDSYVVARGVKT